MNKFRLEPVLRYRVSVEETLRGTLAAKREALRAEQEKREKLEARRQEHLRTLAEKLRGGLVVSEHGLYIEYLRRMDDEMEIRKKAVHAASEAVETARGRLIEAVRQRKTLERLNVKYLAARQQKTRRQEAGLLDEIAVNGFTRNIKTGEKGDFGC